MIRKPNMIFKQHCPYQYSPDLVPYTILIPTKSLYCNTLCLIFLNKLKRKQKKHRQQYFILQEWHQTQSIYYFDLWIAKECIQKPMSLIIGLPNDDLQVLFTAIQDMLALSHSMLDILSRAINNANQFHTCVGSEISQIAGKYKLYAEYFSTHVRRLEILENIQASFSGQMRQIQQNMQGEYTRHKSKKQGMTVKDVLDSPHNRLFKYVLLLKEYIKKMPKHHSDYVQSEHCLSLFQDITSYSNELLKKIQQSETKVRLEKILGDAMSECGDYVMEALAKTVRNEVRIYVFKKMIILNTLFLNSKKLQDFFKIIEFDQFCYAASQPDLKYFKNVAIFINSNSCLQLFFPEPETRNDFVKTIESLIWEACLDKYNPLWTSQSLTMVKTPRNSKSASSSQQRRIPVIKPQFRIQVTGFDIRCIGTLTNDQQFVVRIMIPCYLEEEGASRHDIFKMSQQTWFQTRPSYSSSESDKLGKNFKIHDLNQNIICSEGLLSELYQCVEALSTERIPRLEPDKDISILLKGKNKTKTLEAKKFMVQEFLNFSLRNYQILSTPIWFLSKLKINEDMWSYVVRRNTALKKKRTDPFINNHCALCKYANINSIQDFQFVRNLFSSGDILKLGFNQNYCFNLLNLLKRKILSLPLLQFNTSERMQTFYHYSQGRLDYPFITHPQQPKTTKIVKIHFASIEQNYIYVAIDSKTAVGHVLQEIAKALGLTSVFDFDLMVQDSSKDFDRFLDRDEFVFDIAKANGILLQDCSFKNNAFTKKSGLISTLREWGTQLLHSSTQKKLLFIKTSFLSKPIELFSLQSSPCKLDLEVQRILWVIRHGFVKISVYEWMELISLWVCALDYEAIAASQDAKFRVSNRIIQMSIPDQYSQFYHYEVGFMKEIAGVMEKQVAMLRNHHYSKQFLLFKIIDFSLRNPAFKTFYIPVEPKQIPATLLQANKIPSSCQLGISYNKLVMTKNTTVLLSLPLSEIQYQMTAYSIFVHHGWQVLRFDGVKLYKFGEMIHKYQTILSKFPHF